MPRRHLSLLALRHRLFFGDTIHLDIVSPAPGKGEERQ
jgi:hypothetical protein